MTGLNARAQEILRRNDRGGYTVPTHGLYPYQWNWDSAFVALGFAEFDRDRAWREIETLISAQWEDGMIPHIVFHQEDPGYFPPSRQFSPQLSALFGKRKAQTPPALGCVSFMLRACAVIAGSMSFEIPWAMA
jgi:hypothetical protein